MSRNPFTAVQQDINYQLDARLSFAKKVRSSFFSTLQIFLGIITLPFKLILPGATGALLAASFVVLIISYWPRTSGSTISMWIEVIGTASANILAFFTSVPAVICSALPSTYQFCSGARTAHFNSHEELARVAQTLTNTSRKASTVFESVAHLSNPNNLGFYQAEIWELTFAVRYSSQLEEKDVMATELWELGDLTGILKDHIIDLNGQAINAFSSIAHEFTRVGHVIQWVYAGKPSYTINTIERNLELAFSGFDWELQKLIKKIEKSIPIALKATSLGVQVSERIYRAHYRLEIRQDQKSFWRKIVDEKSYEGQQLRRDIWLTSKSIQTARSLRAGLEEVRSDLVSYRNHVSHFKGTIAGWHLANHGLSAEDELFSMKETLNQLYGVISAAKQIALESPKMN